MEEIDKRYPATIWTHIYTNGSAENAIRNGYVAFSSRDQDCLPFLCQTQVDVCAPTTKRNSWHSTMLQRLWERKPPKAVFLSDSLSALQSFTSETPDDSHKRLMDNINVLAQSTKVILQWIPAHTGIVGNEIADQLAKEGKKKRSAFLTSVIQRNKNSDPQ